MVVGRALFGPTPGFGPPQRRQAAPGKLGTPSRGKRAGASRSDVPGQNKEAGFVSEIRGLALANPQTKPPSAKQRQAPGRDLG